MQNEELVSQLSELLTLAKDGKLSGGVGVFYWSDPPEPGGAVMVAPCAEMSSQMAPGCGIRWTAAAAVESHLNSRFGG